MLFIRNLINWTSPSSLELGHSPSMTELISKPIPVLVYKNEQSADVCSELLHTALKRGFPKIFIWMNQAVRAFFSFFCTVFWRGTENVWNQWRLHGTWHNWWRLYGVFIKNSSFKIIWHLKNGFDKKIMLHVLLPLWDYHPNNIAETLLSHYRISCI